MEPGTVGAVRDGQLGGDCTMPGNNSHRASAAAYEDISDEEPGSASQADGNLLSNSKSSTETDRRRKSGHDSSSASLLFCSPLRIETSEAMASGPASAPCLASHWPHHLMLASPAPSLPLSLASPLLPLTSLYPLTPELMTSGYRGQTSSTPLLSSKLPFSISNILGEKETKQFSSKPPQHFHPAFSQNSTLTDDSGYDSSKLCSSQVETEETEDSYIDVVGLDNDDEEELCTVTSVSINSNASPVLQSDATNIVSEPLSVQTCQDLREGGEHVFDIKKKMFDNWSKSKQSQDLREDLSSEEQGILGGISEYRHKKIRRTSHENQEINHDQDASIGGKKKTFVLEKYELNSSNINKNKRKEEKWSQSETDSPDKKKDPHKLKKKHKSYKEERWKISKTLQKSPLKFPPVSRSRGCVLSEADLLEGLRLLLRVGSHFYAGRLSEISAPDIYGIIVDKERGSKPHIFSRQEIIRDAILEIRPGTVTELERGRRVAVYWSNKMSYLHPGTVIGPDFESDYVLVQLDDGDSRDVHIDQVRFLPENYPHVDATLGAATELEFFGGRKGNDYLNEIRKEKSRARRGKKKEREHKKWSVVVTEVVDTNPTTGVRPSESFHPSQKEDVDNEHESSHHRMDDDQDSAFESDGYKGDSDCDTGNGGSTARRRRGIASFLPPQHRLWRWADTGRKLSPKSRRVYHNVLARGGQEDTETIAVGDCAVFLSTGRPDRPYIGRIHSMWQTGTGNMRVQVMWFYHPAEVEGTVLGGGSLEDITERTENALFSSGHSDENDVQTISHKCTVLTSEVEAGAGYRDEAEVYSLVGEYDPIVGTVTLLQ